VIQILLYMAKTCMYQNRRPRLDDYWQYKI